MIKEVRSTHVILKGRRYSFILKSNLAIVDLEMTFIVLSKLITILQDQELHGMYVWKIKVGLHVKVNRD